MVNEILINAGIKYKETRFKKPPETTFAVYIDDVNVRGADSCNLIEEHNTSIDGDIWVVIVGQNQSGFTLAFAKDKETVIDAEFKALPQDDEGTLIKYIEEVKTRDA